MKKFIPYEKMSLGGTRHTLNMIIYKLIINKKENLCVGVFWKDVVVAS